MANYLKSAQEPADDGDDYDPDGDGSLDDGPADDDEPADWYGEYDDDPGQDGVMWYEPL